MKKILVTTVILATSLGACAKRPDAVDAAQIDSAMYKNYSCRQLSEATLEVNQSIENLSAQQTSAANSDTVGVFFLGLPLSSMGGGDREAQLSIAKGQIQAIDKQKLQKNCS